MSYYKLTLDFLVEYLKCQPEVTPETIAAARENMSLETASERPGGLLQYHAELILAQAPPPPSSRNIIQLFDILPGFDIVHVDVIEIPPPDAAVPSPDASVDPSSAKTGQATKPPTVRCLFRSVLPFEELQASFFASVADGNLVSNGTVGGEYVAFVKFRAFQVANVSADKLKEMTHDTLIVAFEADTEESAVNFMPVSTDVI